MSLNPPLTFANALVELSLMTSQTGNFTFTSDELTQALTEAWNDKFVVSRILDSTLTFTSGTYTYAIPVSMTVVRDIYFQRTSTDGMELLDKSLYEVLNGNIIFTAKSENWLSGTYQLYVRGAYKKTTSDTLDTTHLINYVLNRAAEILLGRLLLKKTFVFLTNDTSVGEITAALNVFRQNVLLAKQGIAREFESV